MYVRTTHYSQFNWKHLLERHSHFGGYVQQSTETEDSLPSSSKQCLHLTFRFSYQNFVNFTHLNLTSAIYPIHPSIHPVPNDLIHQPEQYLKNTNYIAPITQFYPATQQFLSFRSIYCPHHLEHQHPLFKFVT